jgi:hypothetical protein
MTTSLNVLYHRFQFFVFLCFLLRVVTWVVGLMFRWLREVDVKGGKVGLEGPFEWWKLCSKGFCSCSNDKNVEFIHEKVLELDGKRKKKQRVQRRTSAVPSKFQSPPFVKRINFSLTSFFFTSSLLLHPFFSFYWHWHRTTNDSHSIQWPWTTNTG